MKHTVLGEDRGRVCRGLGVDDVQASVLGEDRSGRNTVGIVVDDGKRERRESGDGREYQRPHGNEASPGRPRLRSDRLDGRSGYRGGLERAGHDWLLASAACGSGD
jgi:hypothetical protein